MIYISVSKLTLVGRGL